MGSKIDNFKGKRNTNGFDKNKSNINKNGRPKKTISGIVEELKSEGYERPSQDNITEAYLMFIGLDEEKIKEVVNDKKQTMLIRIVGKNLLSGKGFDIMERLIDRSLGKPKQTLEQNIKTDTTEINPLAARLAEMEENTKKKTKKTK